MALNFSAICCPLVDLIIHGVPQNFFKRFQLSVDGGQLGDENLFKEILSSYGTQLKHAKIGGSATNTLRIFQAASSNLKSHVSSIFVGSVGNDCVATEMVQELKREGIICKCQTNDNLATGCCFALPNEEGRCLVTFPMASRQLTNIFVNEVHEDIPQNGFVFVVSYLFNISPDFIAKFVFIS